MSTEFKRPKICVPLTGKTTEELIAQAEKIRQSSADMVEWRADYFTEIQDLEQTLVTLRALRNKLSNKELLFTFRTKEEGGEAQIRLDDYKELCLSVCKLQLVDMIDIELAQAEFLGRYFIKQLKETQTICLMSYHNFERTPKDAELIFKIGLMQQMGADIGKLALMPQQLNDVLRTMSLIQKAHSFYDLPLAVMAMGDLGKITRVAGELMGSQFTFGYFGENSAPGQIQVEMLDQILTTLSIQETVKEEEIG